MNLKNLQTRNELEHYAQDHGKYEKESGIFKCWFLNSFWLHIDENDNGLSPHINENYWEAWISLWMIRNVSYGMMCADVGANIGYYTYLMNELGAVVDAYEPNPDVFELLAQAWLANNSPANVTMYNEAAGSETKQVTFTVPVNYPMNGSLDGKAVGDDIQVQVTDRIGQQAFDFIKIDIEGGELDLFSVLNPDLHPLVLMEFRWDRYDDPIKFSQDIFKKYNYVFYVDNDGNEVKLDKAHDLVQREHEDWMLVLRRKRKEIA